MSAEIRGRVNRDLRCIIVYATRGVYRLRFTLRKHGTLSIKTKIISLATNVATSDILSWFSKKVCKELTAGYQNTIEHSIKKNVPAGLLAVGPFYDSIGENGLVLGNYSPFLFKCSSVLPNAGGIPWTKGFLCARSGALRKER
jgi:hypothetical protein